ncbi:MAG: hypothetical protein ACPG5P_08785, partial [Saprospiraceae bacterium]
GINYPNKSDKIRNNKVSPGSDIYIHGGCMTIGCIPITNEKIKELYTLVNISKKHTSKTPIHFFPFKMTKRNMKKYTHQFPEHESFWKELEPFYKKFEDTKSIPTFEVNSQGKYVGLN